MSIVAETAASLRQLAEQSHAWPFEEARKIVARLKKRPKDEVIFETGYGPSGLPHIGTFGEVVRTTMVRENRAYLTSRRVDVPWSNKNLTVLKKPQDTVWR